MSAGAGLLTEAQWRDVFRIRCHSKRGHMPTSAEAKLCEAALKQDRARYVDMDADVFDETVPFGSAARRKQ